MLHAMSVSLVVGVVLQGSLVGRLLWVVVATKSNSPPLFQFKRPIVYKTTGLFRRHQRHSFSSRVGRTFRTVKISRT